MCMQLIIAPTSFGLNAFDHLQGASTYMASNIDETSQLFKDGKELCLKHVEVIITTNTYTYTAQQTGVLYKPHPVVWLVCKKVRKELNTNHKIFNLLDT